jgi:hypothetical protein
MIGRADYLTTLVRMSAERAGQVELLTHTRSPDVRAKRFGWQHCHHTSYQTRYITVLQKVARLRPAGVEAWNYFGD